MVILLIERARVKIHVTNRTLDGHYRCSKRNMRKAFKVSTLSGRPVYFSHSRLKPFSASCFNLEDSFELVNVLEELPEFSCGCKFEV